MLYGILYLLLSILHIFLLMRIVLDVTESFARQWRPKGVALLVATMVVSVTDPPLRWLRRRIKPVDLGGIRLDLSFLIFFIVVLIAMAIVRSLGRV